MMAVNRGYQSGQSLIEFVVLAFVLVPLFLIVPLLGKYIDLSQNTTAASRYVAFEGTVHHTSSIGGWKTDEKLAGEVRRRFYSRNDLAIKTNDSAANKSSDRNPLWVDHRGGALLPSFNNITVKTQKESMSIPLGADYADDFDLPGDNLYTGRVNINLADVGLLEPFDKIGLAMDRHTVVLVDPWAARGPDDVKDKVEGLGEDLYPTKRLEPFALWMKVITQILRIVFMGEASPTPNIGEVDPDVVPADRLQPYQ